MVITRTAYFATIRYRSAYSRWPTKEELIPFMVVKLSWRRLPAIEAIDSELASSALKIASQNGEEIIKPAGVNSDHDVTLALRAALRSVSGISPTKTEYDTLKSRSRDQRKRKLMSRHKEPFGDGKMMDQAISSDPETDRLRIAAGLPMFRRGVGTPTDSICHYCEASGAATWDHIVPDRLDGPWAWWNLVPACQDCNSRKGHQIGWCLCPFCVRAQSTMRVVKGPSTDDYVRGDRLDQYRDAINRYEGPLS